MVDAIPKSKITELGGPRDTAVLGIIICTSEGDSGAGVQMGHVGEGLS